MRTTALFFGRLVAVCTYLSVLDLSQVIVADLKNMAS